MRRLGLIGLLILAACGDGGTEPDGPTYSLSDLEGTWVGSGTCETSQYRYTFDAPVAGALTVTGTARVSRLNGIRVCTESEPTAVTAGVGETGSFTILYPPVGSPTNDRLVYRSHLTSRTTTAVGELRYQNQPQGTFILGGEFSLTKQ